jgi:hypothetical protein
MCRGYRIAVCLICPPLSRFFVFQPFLAAQWRVGESIKYVRAKAEVGFH